MKVPSYEQLSEEFNEIFSCKMQKNDISKFDVICQLSWKYNIDIRVLAWRLLGWPRNKYMNLIPLYENKGIKFIIK